MSNTLTPATRRPATSEVVGVVGIVAFGAAALVLSPDHIEDGPVICPFRLATGLPCPGCGLTRAWVYAAHGWWRESFLAHPFGLLLLTVVVALGATALVARVRRRPPPSFERLIRHPVSIAVIAAWLLFAVVRMVASA